MSPRIAKTALQLQPHRTVANKRSKPGGNVNFYNDPTALEAAVPVTNGTAALSVSNPPVKLDSITTVYSGDIRATLQQRWLRLPFRVFLVTLASLSRHMF